MFPRVEGTKQTRATSATATTTTTTTPAQATATAPTATATTATTQKGGKQAEQPNFGLLDAPSHAKVSELESRMTPADLQVAWACVEVRLGVRVESRAIA